MGWRVAPARQEAAVVPADGCGGAGSRAVGPARLRLGRRAGGSRRDDPVNPAFYLEVDQAPESGFVHLPVFEGRHNGRVCARKHKSLYDRIGPPANGKL